MQVSFAAKVVKAEASAAEEARKDRQPRAARVTRRRARSNRVAPSSFRLASSIPQASQNHSAAATVSLPRDIISPFIAFLSANKRTKNLRLTRKKVSAPNPPND